MKSEKLGTNTSNNEILNISNHGLWILANDEEVFLSFEDFPWFQDAKISEIQNFKLEHEHHLHWPTLDIDIDLNSVNQLDKYPLIYKD